MSTRKNTEEYVKTQVRNYDSLKGKTNQSILSDPESAKQPLRRRKLKCYQYKHCSGLLALPNWPLSFRVDEKHGW